jgi:hypothetical protein
MKHEAGRTSGQGNGPQLWRRPAALAVILPLLLLGPGPCSPDRTAGPASAEITEGIITLQWRQALLIQPEEITITFEQVLEDSRCPEGVMCWWAGLANVELSLQKTGRQQAAFTLSDHDMDWQGSDCCRKEDQVWGLTFRYIMLEPYPVYDVTPDSTDYRLQLEIGRRGPDDHHIVLID